MAKPFQRLGEILLAEKLITQEQLKKALDLQSRSPEQPLGDLLVQSGAVNESHLAAALSKQLAIPFLTSENKELTPPDDPELRQAIPEPFARRYHVLPIARQGNTLTVAMADPTDIVVLDNLRLVTGLNIRQVIATAKDIQKAIDVFYGEGGMLKSAVEASYVKEADGDSALIKRDGGEAKLSLDNLIASAEKAPVIHLTDLLISEAIKSRASDIHIEPFIDHVKIRFRVDGVLQEISPPDKSMALPLISRLKIISKMDISEKRLPQDGAFTATIEGRDIDFRVSTIPTVHGEKMVLRILDRRATSMNLDTLGMSAEELARFRKTINKPYGLILITGPTGSGKTTTLYSVINELKGAEKNITTIEDPIEYQIAGINQVAVKSSIGLTFAAGLRAFLRQDPDIMLVGETRDLETAQICVRAALTGHLVFSTLHTNDAPSAIGRLMDIGIEPFYVSASLLMIVAQRLLRRLCPKCKEPYEPAPNQLPAQFKWSGKPLFRPKGCESCNRTGYTGRIPIFEVLYTNEKIQQMIVQRANTNDVREEARRNGMKMLEEYGFEKAGQGLTSIEEVLRMTMAGGL